MQSPPRTSVLDRLPNEILGLIFDRLFENEHICLVPAVNRERRRIEGIEAVIFAHPTEIGRPEPGGVYFHRHVFSYNQRMKEVVEFAWKNANAVYYLHSGWLAPPLIPNSVFHKEHPRTQFKFAIAGLIATVPWNAKCVRLYMTSFDFMAAAWIMTQEGRAVVERAFQAPRFQLIITILPDSKLLVETCQGVAQRIQVHNDPGSMWERRVLFLQEDVHRLLVRIVAVYSQWKLTEANARFPGGVRFFEEGESHPAWLKLHAPLTTLHWDNPHRGIHPQLDYEVSLDDLRLPNIFHWWRAFWAVLPLALDMGPSTTYPQPYNSIQGLTPNEERQCLYLLEHAMGFWRTDRVQMPNHHFVDVNSPGSDPWYSAYRPIPDYWLRMSRGERTRQVTLNSERDADRADLPPP